MQVVQGQEMLVSYRNYFPSICLHQARPLFLAGKNGIMRDIPTLLIMQLIGFGIKLTILEIVWITLTSIFYQGFLMIPVHLCPFYP